MTYPTAHASSRTSLTLQAKPADRMPWLATYDRYQGLSKALTERYRARLCSADHDLSTQFAFHLCHNWGNAAARKVLAKYDRRSSQIIKRRERECRRDEVSATCPLFASVA